MLSGPRAAVRKERTWNKGELKLGREGEACPQLRPQEKRSQPQTHDEVHERG